MMRMDINFQNNNKMFAKGRDNSIDERPATFEDVQIQLPTVYRTNAKGWIIGRHTCPQCGHDDLSIHPDGAWRCWNTDCGYRGSLYGFEY